MRHRLEYLAVVSLRAVLAVLPHAIVRLLGASMGQVAYWVDAKHRRVAMTNLAQSFPTRSRAEVQVQVLAIVVREIRRRPVGYPTTGPRSMRAGFSRALSSLRNFASAFVGYVGSCADTTASEAAPSWIDARRPPKIENRSVSERVAPDIVRDYAPTFCPAAAG